MGYSASTGADEEMTCLKGVASGAEAVPTSSAESGIETGSGFQGEAVQESEMKSTHNEGTADPTARDYHTNVSAAYESVLHKK